MSRGGPKLLQVVVVNAQLSRKLTFDKLRGHRYPSQFLPLANQKESLVSLVPRALNNFETLDLFTWVVLQRSRAFLSRTVFNICAQQCSTTQYNNIVLDNLCKTENEKLTIRRGKPKATYSAEMKRDLAQKRILP